MPIDVFENIDTPTDVIDDAMSIGKPTTIDTGRGAIDVLSGETKSVSVPNINKDNKPGSIWDSFLKDPGPIKEMRYKENPLIRPLAAVAAAGISFPLSGIAYATGGGDPEAMGTKLAQKIEQMPTKLLKTEEDELIFNTITTPIEWVNYASKFYGDIAEEAALSFYDKASMVDKNSPDYDKKKFDFASDIGGSVKSGVEMAAFLGLPSLFKYIRAKAITGNPKQIRTAIEDIKAEKKPVDITDNSGKIDLNDPVELAYESYKDVWQGEKDVRIHDAGVEARLTQKELIREHKTDPLKSEYTPKEIDEAIQIHIDSKRNPNAIPLVFDKLSPEQQKIVSLSQNLPEYAKNIVKNIEDSYREIGIDAYDTGVIKNQLDNYASRVWEAEPKKTGIVGKKFGTTTSHAKKRKIGTIVEGWAIGKELKIKSASENLRIYKEELVRAIEDKRFVESLRNTVDMEGNKFLSTKQLDGYIKVEHPNMTVWEWAGEAGKGISLDPKLFEELKVMGEELKTIALKDGSKSAPMAKLETVVEESLVSRGMTPGEAQTYISKLKTGGASAVGEIARDMATKAELASKSISDIPTSKAKAYGKNFFVTEDGTLFERRQLYAPKKYAKDINNILGTSKLMDIKGIKTLTRLNAEAKSWILQSSLFHHQAFMRSFYLPGMDVQGFKYTPRQAMVQGVKAIESSDPVLRHGVRNGLTLGKNLEWDEALLRQKTWIGKQLDKTKATKSVKDTINRFREIQTDFLFGEMGAGYKALAYIEKFKSEIKKYPSENKDVVAKRVASLINDDFGGLHLQRMGRNPTTQHIFRLAALAPDWTESNIRSLVKTLTNKSKSSAELSMYRRFWGGVVLKTAGITAIANYIMAGGDINQYIKNYEQAWKDGNFNWMKVNITPIRDFAANVLGKDPNNKRKYFSVGGHFQDPAKWIVHPIKSAKYKASVIGSMGMEALTGSDWASRNFTTIEDLFKTGETVKWGIKKGPIDYDQFPSYFLAQLVGTQPVQLQNLIGYINGEMDGFDALFRSIGVHTTSTYESNKSKKLKGLSGGLK